MSRFLFRLSAVLVLLLACAAAMALLGISAPGIGLRSDSAVYVAAARNLVDGKGLSWISGGGEIHPLTLHAPFLPVLLASVEAFGGNSIHAARALNAACLSLEVLLVGALAYRLTRSGWLTALAALVMGGTGEVYRVHVWLMSEPLFITLMLAGTLALLEYRQARKPGWLLVAAIAFGLAGLTRYGGLALALAGVAFLLSDAHSPWRRRLRESGLMLLLGLGPTVIWMGRNHFLTGQTGGRVFGVHLDLWQAQRDQALGIILNWYAPLRVVEWIMTRPEVVAVLVFLAGTSLLVVAALPSRRGVGRVLAQGPSLSGIFLLGLCSLSYVGVAFLASLFFSPGADVDERVLSPVYPLLWLILVAGLGWIWFRGRLLGKLLVVVLLALLVRNKLVYTYWTLRELRADGLGYASRAWQTSDTIRALTALDPGVIYTNDTAAIYLLADRPSYVVPWGLPDYDPAAAGWLEAMMMGVLVEKDGALVLFGEGGLPAGWSGSGLKVGAQADDGVILVPADPGLQ